MKKKRADVLLFEKGLVDSREKGKRIIMEGSVYVGNLRVDKPGDKFDENVEIYIKSNPLNYVSRGGLKLEKAIAEFNLELNNAVAMDIGSSTGGFTDCMLQNNASKVYAVDVGYGQLDWKLRNDSRVVVMERTNIRNISSVDGIDLLDFISIDVSFISLKLVLPVAKSLLKENGEIVALVKPQFEAGKEKVGKKGIIKDKAIHIEVLDSIINFCNSINLGIKGLSFSPITGAKGNIEFLIYLVNNKDYAIDKKSIRDIVEEGHMLLK
ncbi:TlyA family RNA methyltransferase [Wansuia hejianensis]|uniref:TlyA family RNA methyltransferase n=1 Tax=Wansuia hejianensis TaxID=2763667 RepID=A0A926IML3_9FIRM|nr:TlyA family RNA methyltransferase [Wansuia hejianensis]MBC8590565.1 TlyA family RNA methyltransferase [Wansuia hejianensis]